MRNIQRLFKWIMGNLFLKISKILHGIVLTRLEWKNTRIILIIIIYCLFLMVLYSTIFLKVAPSKDAVIAFKKAIHFRFEFIYFFDIIILKRLVVHSNDMISIVSI